MKGQKYNTVDAGVGDLETIEGAQMANSIWSRWYIPEDTYCSWNHESDPYTQVFLYA